MVRVPVNGAGVVANCADLNGAASLLRVCVCPARVCLLRLRACLCV